MPVWMARFLSRNSLCKVTFSKYGTYYKDVVMARQRAAAYEKIGNKAWPARRAEAEGSAPEKEIYGNVRQFA